MSGEEIKASIDFVQLARWMSEEGLGSGPIEGATRLAGGTQNIMLRFSRGDQQYVLRRPPAHSLSDGGVVTAREARLLAALRGSGVPHPDLIAVCSDPTVIGASFYLMQAVEGCNLTLGLEQGYIATEWQRSIGHAMVDGLIALQSIDPFTRELGDLARLDGYLERQAGRWRSQLEGYSRFENWPGPSGLPGVDRASEWLSRNVPTSMVPGIVHGDYHLANVMFQHSSPQIAAIIDWELGTIGDPLLDLGWLMATWPDEAGRSTGSGIAIPGATDLSPASELIAHYRASTSRPMSDWPWFAILACYKLAILQEGTYARACANMAPADLGMWSHDRAVEMMARANDFIKTKENGGEPGNEL